jgi:hypothetical protein
MANDVDLIRNLRDQNISRVAQANGAALATCAIVIATRPPCWAILSLPCAFFGLGILISICIPMFSFAEILYRERILAELRRVEQAEAALNASGSVDSAVAVLAARRQRGSGFHRFARFALQVITWGIANYIVLGGVCFAAGVGTSFGLAFVNGIPTETGTVPTPNFNQSGYKMDFPNAAAPPEPTITVKVILTPKQQDELGVERQKPRGK